MFTELYLCGYCNHPQCMRSCKNAAGGGYSLLGTRTHTCKGMPLEVQRAYGTIMVYKTQVSIPQIFEVVTVWDGDYPEHSPELLNTIIRIYHQELGRR